MARLIDTQINQINCVKVVTSFSDGSTDEKILKIGDIVENLRYVADKKVNKVSGRITDIGFTVSAASNSVVDKILSSVTLGNFTIDASTEYNSNIVTFPTRELVEDEGVENVTSVHCYPQIIVELKMIYTDGTEKLESIEIGDKLTDVTIMGLNAGDADITGDFTVVAFGYTMTNKKPVVYGFALKDSNDESATATMYNITRFVNFFEIQSKSAISALDITNAIRGSKYVNINVKANINIDDTIHIVPGQVVTLNLGNSKITKNDNDDVILSNGGDLTLIGGELTGKGIINGGTLKIEDTSITSTDTANAAIINNGSLIIDDATLAVTHVGSASDAKGCACLRNHGNAVIQNITCESPSMRTYAIISDGNIVINDGNVTLNGTHGALAIDAGEAEIYGGNYKSTEYYGIYVSNDGNGTDPEKAAVTIYGGTYEGKTTSAFVGSDDNDPVNSTLDIRGGVFKNKLQVQKNVEEAAGIRVYGGLFVTPVENKYVADGYYATDTPDENGYYTVKEGVKEETTTPVVDLDGPVDDEF